MTTPRISGVAIPRDDQKYASLAKQCKPAKASASQLHGIWIE